MISIDRLSQQVLQTEYAVRGSITIRAQELEAKGRKVIYCNIGNPQALKQPPLTCLRQLLSLLEYPELLKLPSIGSLFPEDIVERARSVLRLHPAGMGAYTQSAGILFIRNAVADFIARRDGITADPAGIILTDGASKGAQLVLTALINSPRAGFMLPIPQYPLYSATLALLGGQQIGYFLDEQNRWQLSEAILTESLAEARKRGIDPIGIVVINPGNPTGAVLSRENIEMIIRFASRHDLSIIADEVYQENVYAPGCAFHSFARTMHALGDTTTPLFSLHSVSKGFLGECGHRGGYLEIRNVPDDVLHELVKLQSIGLCANVPGQIATYLMVTPPLPGDESYGQYDHERNAILTELRQKADILSRGINAIPGMSVTPPEGALYAFVRFDLLDACEGAAVAPPGCGERTARDAAREAAYCLELLEETGICVVPGSGFGQLPGTHHFRMTFLPPKEEIAVLVRALQHFHLGYTRRRQRQRLIV